MFVDLNDDICLILKEIDLKRIKIGKDDSYKLNLQSIRRSVQKAKETKIITTKEDLVERAKEFF
jgi:hypothetical protein